MSFYVYMVYHPFPGCGFATPRLAEVLLDSPELAARLQVLAKAPWSWATQASLAARPQPTRAWGNWRHVEANIVHN